MINVVGGFGAWKSDGCSVKDVLDQSLITFNCTYLTGYAVLLVRLCIFTDFDLRTEVWHDNVSHNMKPKNMLLFSSLTHVHSFRQAAPFFVVTTS